jgi:primosomal protein N' (replication factor Y)
VPVAQVVVDIPAREIDAAFDYAIPTHLEGLGVGDIVVVEFGRRPAVGYVVGVTETSSVAELKPIRGVSGSAHFGPEAVEVARWIATTYVAPLSESLRLFTAPGGAPRATRDANGWSISQPAMRPVDDRWAMLARSEDGFEPSPRATVQRAVLDALGEGPVRVAELKADLGPVGDALRRLEARGAVRLERRRRMRGGEFRLAPAPRHERLTSGQDDALAAISSALDAGGGVILLDGVTGSGKTEVYLRAIERVRAEGGSAIVLVPEISLTPQTVGRFRSRFGDDVAVLHSRLAAGERFDQWDRVAQGDAQIVVGARSALFAPAADVRLIVIDEEHESSYKQGSSPRYHARDVAERLAEAHGATLVLGSASPSMEARYRCESGKWTRIGLPERVHGRPLPDVEVVDMTGEFEDGNRSMFSRALQSALTDALGREEKAVLLLNRRGFASFLLCRECGFVPTCDSCSTSMTYHDVGQRLACHHCGATRVVPGTCPRCDGPYLRQFGAGTQRVESDLGEAFPGVPVVRMDADTTAGRGGHERALAEFEAVQGRGVLLGTQMIAKGLDFPEVTLVGVINADTALHLPDFRSSERTYQMLEQVAGRAGRGERPGRVVMQTYWPDHPAIQAAASHSAEPFYAAETEARRELAYPPFARLVNVIAWGRDEGAVRDAADMIAGSLAERAPDSWRLLGPSPAPLSRLRGVHRWHLLVKAPQDADVSAILADAREHTRPPAGVTLAVDVDPVDLL